MNPAVIDNKGGTSEGKREGRSRMDRLLRLSFKHVLLIALAWIVSVVLHNVVYGLFKGYFDRTGSDEPFFFAIALLVIPLYLIASIAYTLVVFVRRLLGGRSG